MRGNTIIMIVLAGVFGVLAVVLANMWLADQRGAVAAASDEPRDTIVVARVALKFGDTLTTDNLREISWPSGSLPTGAFKNRTEVLAGEGQRQVLTPIGVNEPVLTSKITGPGQRATLSAVLADGMKAISIRVNDVLGVAGFVLPGDRVDILLSRNIRNAQGGDEAFVDVLLQGVKVLAIDQVADESQENATVVKAVTLEVSTKDAQKLTLAAGIGQLSLALREVASDKGEDTGRVTTADLVGAVQGATVVERVEPVAEPVQVVKVEPPARASIGVYRGIEREVYDVPRTR
jgi:pilus assembly protein CpaB